MPRTIDELYDTLQPDEQAFFDLLDHELEKVETFYTQREVEATRQAQQLRDQMRDLSEHRRVFHEAFPEGVPEWEAAMSLMLPVKSQKPVMRAVFRRQGYTAPTDDDQHLAPTDSAPGSVQPPSPAGSAELRNHAEEQARLAKQYDPDRYQKAKKELRRAMLEFYRHLELIKNYRILNLTGFRKALKKFEKTTHIQCLELYTEDRITPCSFSRGDTIDTLLQQTEDLFTEHFEHGNKKKARTKLRQQDQPVTHYFTVFRSGTMIGLGLPAAVLAIVKSFDPETRAALPAYQALLQIYAALYMPVIFSMLFELDLQAWIDVRINYEVSCS
jgi:SPX domain protein involved in polyphosphate accumulation